MFSKCKARRRVVAGILSLGLAASPLFAQITSQWRGAQRDGIYDGNNLLQSWPAEGPAILFSAKNIGSGYSSPVVTADRVYVIGMVDKTGYLSALDQKGALVWKSNYGPEWSESFPGVRGTPTVEGDRIYLVSGKGRVVCLNAADGKEVWSVDMVTTFKGQMPKWGFSESVLIDGDRLFCTPGGPQAAVAALDKANGKTLWTTAANGEMSGYCSPMMVQHGGKKLLVTMMGKSIIGFDATSGKLLWQFEHKTDWGINPNTPIYTNGNLLCFSGYGQGTVMLKLSDDGSGITKVWSNPQFDSQIGGAVLLGDKLYASSHKKPAWHCLDIKDGTIRYSLKAGGGGGCLIAAGGLLYCYSDKGDVSLMKPEADKFTVVSKFPVKLGNAQHWAHPVIANGKLFIRHGDVLIAYGIGK